MNLKTRLGVGLAATAILVGAPTAAVAARAEPTHVTSETVTADCILSRSLMKGDGQVTTTNRVMSFSEDPSAPLRHALTGLRCIDPSEFEPGERARAELQGMLGGPLGSRTSQASPATTGRYHVTAYGRDVSCTVTADSARLIRECVDEPGRLRATTVKATMVPTEAGMALFDGWPDVRAVVPAKYLLPDGSVMWSIP